MNENPTEANNLSLTRLMEGQDKLILNLTYKCNNHCTFCSIADRPIRHADFAALGERMRRAVQDGIRLLDLDGGEPTLYPEFFALLDEAVALGFRTITVTSNGRRLSDPDFLARLARYPIHLLVSLHSAVPEEQDALTRTPGSFRQTVKGLMQARCAFPRLGVNTTIVRDNLGNLDRLGALLVRLGVTTWNLQAYTPFGNVDPAFAADPYESAEAVSRLLERFGRSLAIQLVNVPPCVLPPEHVVNALPDAGKHVRIMRFVDGTEVNLADYLATRRFKNGGCADCTYTAICDGFWDVGRDPAHGESSRLKLVDVIPSYACNSRCLFCAVSEERAEPLSREAWRNAIRRSLVYGPRAIRFGGGEPTIHPELFEMIAFARALGFEEIGLQTNGYRLADDAFRAELIAAGVNAVHVSTHGAEPVSHRHLSGEAGELVEVERAITTLATVPGVKLTVDALLLAATLPRLAGEVAHWAEIGVTRLNLWQAQPEGRAARSGSAMAALLADTVRALRMAFAVTPPARFAALRLYYLPLCLAPELAAYAWHPADERALVITPQGRFRLERERFVARHTAAPCLRCAKAAVCTGVPEARFGLWSERELRPYTEP